MVQATYLMLALLMGGGLVLFGIGGDVSAGSSTPSRATVAAATRTTPWRSRSTDKSSACRRTPNVVVLQSLVTRQLSARDQPAAFRCDDLPRGRAGRSPRAANYWQRYLKAEDEAERGDGSHALRVYDVGALNQPKEAQRAATIIAEAQNDPNAYLQLVAYASLARDERTADLATQKAVDLAPKNQRKQVEQQAEALKQSQQQTQQPSG